MDENVPLPITVALRRRGVDVLTVQEDGRRHTPDPVLLDRAAELDRVMFTIDDDLVAEAARRIRSHEPFAGVIYVHQRNVSIGQCVGDLAVIAGASDPPDWVNRVEFLPL